MSSQDDIIRNLREKNENLSTEVKLVEKEINRANDAYILLEQELKEWQEKYAISEKEKKAVEDKVALAEKNYEFMEKDYVTQKGRWEKAEAKVAKVRAEKADEVRKLKEEKEAHRGTKTRYNNFTQDVEARIKQVVKDTKAKAEKERIEKGLVLVNATEHETYKKLSRTTEEVNTELVALKKQLAHYETNEMAGEFPHDLASRDDFDDFAPSSPILETTLPRTLDEEIIMDEPSDDVIMYEPADKVPTTDSATQTKEGLELGPADSESESESEPEFTATIGARQSTSPVIPPSVPTRDSEAQVGGDEQLTTTIGARQSTSPVVVPTRNAEAQVGGEQLTTVIGAVQSTAPVGDEINIKQEDKLKIIEIIKNRVIHHHNIAACVWETIRNMIIISRKVVEQMPINFTNPLPRTFRRGGSQQALDADHRSSNRQPLLDIIDNPNSVEMPPILRTIIDFLMYLIFLRFMFECITARAWVTEMMANNGLYRSYFSDLYTYRDREGRGFIRAVSSEAVARFAEQFTLALVRHVGIDLETYPMPG